MLYTSLKYLIFLPIALLLYFICPKKFQWIVLLIASYTFYALYDWRFSFLLLGVSLITYLSALLIDYKRESKAMKNFALIMCLVLCFGLLVLFKYLGFFSKMFSSIINAITHKGKYGIVDVLLPIGISFYIFQTTSYVIDVYRGQPAEKHIGYYGAFASFFPTLLAGPISRSKDLLPQIKAGHSIKEIDFAVAARYLLLGYFKKVAVANIISIFVNSVYGNLAGSNGLVILVATILFAFQILCDFSGYSDISVGSAKLFGIDLMENFKEPYGATSIKGFWNRWHLSLSTWFRDYIYFPLGGSRVNAVRWAFNVMIVFLVSGFWHGANYTFIIWGALHAVFQIIGKFTLGPRNKLLTKMKIDVNGKFVKIARIILTFLLVDFAWIFFVSNSIQDAGLAIAKIFTDWKGNIGLSFTNNGMSVYLAIYLVAVIALALYLEKIKYFKESNIKPFTSPVFRYAAYSVMLLLTVWAWIYLASKGIAGSFIYFEF